jgi:flagella basal body P-ring formation protein FlgA
MMSSIYKKYGSRIASSDKHDWLWLTVLLLLIAVIVESKVFASETSTQSIPSIKAAAQKFITNKIAQEYPHHVIEVGAIDPRLKLSACDSPLDEFIAPGSGLLGRVTIGVRCLGNKPWTIYVPALVKGIRKVVITTHPILRNTSVAQEDICLEERTITANTSDYIYKPEQILGKIIVRTLPASTALKLNMLSAPILVRRGQQVIILAEETGLEVRMAGTALMDGTSGQTIRVINSLSKRTVEGRVIQPGLIKVNM